MGSEGNAGNAVGVKLLRMGQKLLNEKEKQRMELPKELPVLPARGVVFFPNLVLPLAVSGESDEKLIHDAVMGDRLIAVSALKDLEVEDPALDHLHETGCAVTILKMLKFPDSTTRMLVQGLSRIKIGKGIQAEPYLRAEITPLESAVSKSIESEALAQSVVAQFNTLVDLSPHLPEELKMAVLNIEDASRTADLICSALNLTLDQRQKILETLEVEERLQLVASHLTHEVQTAELSSKIQNQVQDELADDQRKFILRRQIKALQEELGEEDDGSAEIRELTERIEALKLPEDAKKEAERELDRLKRMPPQASEYHVARTYLDWISTLPWNESTRDRLDIPAAEKVLNDEHYDLEKVKTRILEYLAVRKLKKDSRGPILCFVGPPGTGKTSLGRSIAHAMGRKFVRVALGGVRDESEIRGHRRTYVGALPGRIIQGLRKAESRNPVFMLDEIDKLGADFHGDPASALLEVLDPEQNYSFTDHYLDVAFDLSHVMFITTANVLDTIPPALRDRMEVLELPGYTTEEKIIIAHRYLVPRQIEENGLKEGELVFDDTVLQQLITNYTREAGLRNLEREIGTLCRKHAAEVARHPDKRDARTLTPEDLAELLGPPRHIPDIAERTSEPGVATGLAWTQSGGDILFIECTRYPGNGRLLLTGQLGDVMKESGQAALSYVRSKAEELDVPPEQFSKIDLHIHVPAGAIPKDGPSAGITIAMALIGAFTGRRIRPFVAMTGEITLRGRVMPVGGIKEKVLAARRAGIRTVVMPAPNEKDIVDVPEAARKDMKFVFVETVDQVLPHVFEGTTMEAAEAGKTKPDEAEA